MKLTKLNCLIAFFLLGLVTNALAQRPFNKSKDILIAQFDSKPDPDDIHAQAALGSMLAHNDFAGVKYYAVAGAVGKQGGRFIDSDALFDMAFGRNNWTDADANRSASVTNIKNKVKPILQNGGKVWVQEAGQSDITRDWIQALKNDGVASNIIKSNVIVVQHSKWNEDMTSNGDLNWVKNNANYKKIADGNSGGNGTPSYRSTNKSFLNQAKASNNPNTIAKALWTEADRVIQNHGHKPSHSSISTGGVDYSDCVENWWIFSVGGNADNISKFWSRYVTNTTGSNPDPDPDPDPDPNPCTGKVFEEKNGVAAVEAEHFTSQEKTSKRKWYVFNNNTSGTPTPDPDPNHANGASGGGYLEILPDTRVTHGDPLQPGISFSDVAGQTTIVNYKVKFTSAGRYFVWVRAHSTGSEDNGVHVGLNGKWPASGNRMQWCSGKNQWTWESKQRTSANHCGEAQKIYLDIPSAGVHTISFSLREDGFEMDKFVLSKTYTKPTGNGPAEIPADCDTGSENVAPQVGMTSPANGAVFGTGETITLSANASDSDGTISKVEFYVNGNLVATENQAPYNTTTTISTTGSYTITAKATDNDGASTTSTNVVIKIEGDTPPPTNSIDIPGVFEAEGFASKSGSVRIENTPGTSGKNLGFIKNGDYTEYTVNVQSNGTYTFDISASSAGKGGTVDIIEAGKTVGSVTIPVTGQWHDYKSYTVDVSLTAGEKNLRLVYKGAAGYLFNIDKVTASKVATVEQTVTLSAIQDAYLQGSTRHNKDIVRIEQNKRTGYLMFDLSSINGTITKAQLKFKVASDAGNGNLNVNKGTSDNWTENNLSNANKPSAGALLGNLNATYGLGNSKTINLNTTSISGDKLSLIMSLTSGNDFAFASKENGINTPPQLIVTYMAGARQKEVLKEDMNIKADRNPVQDKLVIRGKDFLDGARVSLVNMNGDVIKTIQVQSRVKQVELGTADLPAGIYFVRLNHKAKSETLKIIKN